MSSAPETRLEILARRTGRIGLMTLERENGDRYFVAIRNRSYHARHEVPLVAARRWWRYLRSW